MHFDWAIKILDFDQNEDEPYVYKKMKWNMIVFLILYVDDIILIRNSIGLLSSINVWLSTQF